MVPKSGLAVLPSRGIPFRTVILFSRCCPSMNYPKSTRKKCNPRNFARIAFYEVYTLEVAFLQSFCIMDVCGGGAYLWLYLEHPDSGFLIYATETTSHKRNLRRR
ncbi:hypothetical protein ADH70_015785 [Blautia pseudococcoides]|nr:hypothetical protein ADH70_015785 [Blautia pseudococcoides]